MLSYKARITAFYEKYAPNKISQIDTQLEKYKGQEEDLMQALVQKYGPEPAAAVGGGAVSMKDRLTAFYEKYAPNKLAQVDAQLEKYKGQEEDFMQALVQKYGPEPAAASGGSAPSPPSFVRSRTVSQMNGSTPTSSGTYYERLLNFYKTYAPNKISQIDTQLEKYKGQEEDLMQALVQKYGPEPAAAVGGGAVSMKDRLTAFYEKYAPNKISQIDTQLEKYKGQEEDFIQALVQKYGPEPAAASGGNAPSLPSFVRSRTVSQMNGSTPTSSGTYYERLLNFYKTYAPNKISQIDTQLEKYKGQEEDLMQALVQKYGPEPAAAVGGGAVSMKDRLTAFYEKYAPNKLAQVDAQLEKYKGQEEDFMQALVQKYGPEPAAASGGNAPSPPSSVRSRTVSQMNGSTPTSSGTYYERLLNFYKTYAPNKISQIDTQLEKYKGQEEDLMQALVQKYGPEPAAAVGGGAVSMKDRLTAFYEKYAPNKLAQVDAQLEKYKGQEEDFMQALVQKYGPEPAAASGGNAPSPPSSVRSRTVSQMNGSTPTSSGTYYERLLNFYKTYAPNKISQIDTQLEKYKGQEEDLMQALVQKYGPEPAAAVGGGAVSMKDRLTAFYEKYAPNKISQIDTQLEKYKGQEEDFIQALVQKYGPEPIMPVVSAESITAPFGAAEHVQSNSPVPTCAIQGEPPVAAADFLTTHVSDANRRAALREIAAEAHVTVQSEDTLRVLEALYDAKMEIATHAEAPLERSSAWPITHPLPGVPAPRPHGPLSAVEIAARFIALVKEESAARAALELLADDDHCIISAESRRAARAISLCYALRALCAATESAVLRTAFTSWYKNVTERLFAAHRARQERMTPYQRMLYGPLAAAYEKKMIAAHIEKARRDRKAATDASRAAHVCRERVRRSIAAHGDVVKRNMLAVILPAESLSPRGVAQKSQKVRKVREAQDAEAFRYAARGARLRAIEKDFDSLPPAARARVFRSLRNWDMLPAPAPSAPRRPGDSERRSNERRSNERGSNEGSGSAAAGPMGPEWWGTEAGLREYLARVLVEALDEEDAQRSGQQDGGAGAICAHIGTII